MTKRRLNHQQLRRIDSNQQQRGNRATLGLGNAGDEPSSVDGAELPGLIICHYGQQLDIESLEENSRGQIFRCHQRSNLPALVTGDRVIWLPAGPDTGVVVALEERSSVLARPTTHGEQRPVAANVDIMAVVIAPLPQPFANLIDRYLVAAEHLGLQAIILLNKTDLLNEERDAGIEPMLDLYCRIGYRVIRVSTKSENGITELRECLAQHTAVFVGQSGVGKSSLINSLRASNRSDKESLATDEIHVEAAVGEMSIGRDKGTHTTTATRLYHLPGSGDLIDSPGIREFGLWHMSQRELISGYVEFKPFIDRCRFRDCQHQHEPGCALLAAQETGLIAKERLASYFHTLSTIANLEFAR